MPTFWGREWQVNASGAGTQLKSDITVLSNGDYLVTYLDTNPTPDAIRAQRFNGFGEPIGAEIVVGTTNFVITDNTTAAPSVTTLPNGEFAIAWLSATNTLSLQKFTAAGAPNGGAITVAPNVDSFVQSFDMVGLADGTIAATYTRNVSGEEDIILKIISATGSVGGEINVDVTASSSQYISYIASNGSNLVASWYDGSVTDVQARIFSLTGGLSGSETTLNTTTSGVQAYSPIVALPGSNYVSVWADYTIGTLRGQLLTASLAKTGAEFVIAVDLGVNGDNVHAIAATQNGGFFVAYQTSTGVLFGQAVTALGTLDGARIRIADNVSLTDTVKLATLPDGRIAATWTDNSNRDGSASGIFTRIIDPRDGLVDGDGNANTLYGHQFLTDQISGFGGNDTIFALGGDDLVFGGDGNDLVFGWTGRDVLWGDFGNDTLHGEQDNDVLLGVDGNDVAFGGDGADTLYGWFGSDTLWGGNGDDLILGEQDNDLILGEAGNDQLDGNDGNDTLFGFFGNDTLLGGAGADELRGEQDNDLAFGSTGNDTIFGGNGNDTLFGEQDNDILIGELGNDLLNGQEGQDTLYGFDGDDTLFGFTGNDSLFGEVGNDVMLGEDGNDFLGGQAGNDFMVGGRGADTLFGDGGDDIFVFALADLQNGIADEINAFAEVGGNFDLIRFEGIAPAAVSTGQIGPNTVINVAIPGGTATIIVTSFNAGAILDQFIFV
jgi:Ca2+-binding RTX toxin-like protein